MWDEEGGSLSCPFVSVSFLIAMMMNLKRENGEENRMIEGKSMAH